MCETASWGVEQTTYLQYSHLSTTDIQQIEKASCEYGTVAKIMTTKFGEQILECQTKRAI